MGGMTSRYSIAPVIKNNLFPGAVNDIQPLLELRIKDQFCQLLQEFIAELFIFLNTNHFEINTGVKLTPSLPVRRLTSTRHISNVQAVLEDNDLTWHRRNRKQVPLISFITYFFLQIHQVYGRYYNEPINNMSNETKT